MGYQAVVFDFFDVIGGDPFKRWLKVNGFERAGEFEESSRLVDIGHISEHEFYQRLSELSGKTVKSVEEAFAEAKFIDKEVVELVEKLSKNYKTGLLSNSSSEYLRPILEQHDLARLFDEIVISSEVGIVKPTEEIFHHVLQKLGVKPENTLFIDDSPRNVAAAASLGIQAIPFRHAKGLKQDLLKLNIATK